MPVKEKLGKGDAIRAYTAIIGRDGKRTQRELEIEASRFNEVFAPKEFNLKKHQAKAIRADRVSVKKHFGKSGFVLLELLEIPPERGGGFYVLVAPAP